MVYGPKSLNGTGGWENMREKRAEKVARGRKFEPSNSVHTHFVGAPKSDGKLTAARRQTV